VKLALRSRRDRSLALVPCRACGRWTCPVCFYRQRHAKAVHYAGRLLAAGSPITVLVVEEPAWGSLRKSLQRAKGNYLRVEARPGLFIVFTTAATSGGEVLSPEDAVRRLVEVLLTLGPRRRAQRGKPLLRSSRAWTPPRKAKGEWERVGRVKARDPERVLELLQGRGLDPEVQDPPAGGAEWVVAWVFPPAWTRPEVDGLIGELTAMAG
jgi:hypothetical protein